MSPDNLPGAESPRLRRRPKKLHDTESIDLRSGGAEVAPARDVRSPRSRPLNGEPLQRVVTGRRAWALALGCGIAGQALLTFNLSVPLGAALLLAGGGLVFARVRKLPQVANPQPLDRWSSAGLLALFLVSLAIRIYQNDSYPPSLFYDEAYSGLEGIRITSLPGLQVWSYGLSGRPTFDLYVFNLAFRLFGVSVASLRGVAALGGALTVLFTFLAARELIGTRGAWLAGLILMVSRWDLTFSRIAYEAIWSCVFATAVIWLLAGGVRRSSTTWLVLASIPFALGLYTYISYRLFVIPVAIFWLQLLWQKRRAALPAAIGFVVVGLVVAGPILVFAAQNPTQFTYRFSQVSIFLDIAAQHSLKPLLDNILLHLGMFNYRGGTGARHNLPFVEPRQPGVPELGFPFAVCFALGAGALLARFRRLPYVLLATTVVTALSAGFLTILAESPDPTRTILAVPVTAWCAAMFLDLLLGSLGGRPVMARQARLAVATPILVLIAAVELVTYYRQATFVAAYHEFQHNLGSEAYYLQPRLGRNDTYVSSPVRTFPTDAIINFINYPHTVSELSLFDPSTTIPAPPHHRPVSYLLSLGPGAIMQPYLQAMYPRGTAVTHANPAGEAEYVTFDIPAGAIAASAGLSAQYRASGQAPRRTEPTVDSEQNPPPIAAPFDVTWTGTLVAPTWASYAFQVSGPGAGMVTVDGIDAGGSRPVSLAAGPHALEVRKHVDGAGRIQLLWAANGGTLAPVPATSLYSVVTPDYGLEVRYYLNAQDPATLVSVERAPGLSAIPPAVGFQRAVWRGELDVPTTGQYQFWFLADDYGSVAIDQKVAIDTQGKTAGVVQTGQVTLTAGEHAIEIQLVNLVGGYDIGLDWAPPGKNRTAVPPSAFRPIPES